MKKKILVLLCMSLLFAGCGQEKTNTSIVESNVSLESKESTVESKEEMKEEKSLESLCAYLESKNVISGDKITMAGEMIGAKSGVKYTDSSVEIYEYDLNSDAYKNAVSTKKANLQGFNIEVEFASVVNGYAIITNTDDSNLVRCFEEYLND